MKFIHVSDVRLGVTPDRDKEWQQKRKEEIYDDFFRFVDYVKENSIDLILISGNLFDYVPGVDELTMLDDSFKELTDTLIIYQPGCRDLLKPDSALFTYSFHSNIYVPGVPERCIRYGSDSAMYCEEVCMDDCHFFSFPRFTDKPLNIYGEPYKTGGKELPDLYRIRPDKNAYNILMTFSEDYRYRNRGYDYIAVSEGHYYRMLIRNMMYASGAFEPTSPEETGKHGFVEGVIPETVEQKKQIRFINFAGRQYKTINYPVNKYMTSMEIAEDLIHLMKKEGSENIYTVNLVRNEACEKNFDIKKHFEFETLYILEINGEHYDRESYEKYIWANRNTAFGGLLGRLYTSNPLERDGAKLAVDKIIEKSGVNNRKSDKIYDKTYFEAKKAALNILSAMKNELTALPEVKEYQNIKEQLEAGREADAHLTELVAEEQKQEIQLAIEKSDISIISEKYKRKWRRNGLKFAIVPFIILIFLCISWLPSVIRVGFGNRYGAELVIGMFACVVMVVMFFYLFGYFSSKIKDTRYEDRGINGEIRIARNRIADADIKLSEIRKERKKYQLIKERNQTLQKSLDKSPKLEKELYEIKIIEEAITVLMEK